MKGPLVNPRLSANWLTFSILVRSCPSCLQKSFAAVGFRQPMQSLLDGYVETNPNARGGRRRLGWDPTQNDPQRSPLRAVIEKGPASVIKVPA
jgi:hypothetical protein